MRYFDVFRKSLFYYFVTTLVEPILSLLSFSFGVGSLVKTVHAGGMDVSYRKFIFAGVVGQTLLFQGFFEAAYGGYIRMYYQKIFHSMGTTPITLSEVLWGEIIWDSTKAAMAAVVVAVIGVLFGYFPPLSILLTFPICFIGAMIFSGLGLYVAAGAKTIEQISYPQYLFVFPMFLFCGVFFPIETLPTIVQIAAKFLPLTAILSLLRTVDLGFPFEWWAVPNLVCWWVVFVLVSRRRMLKRLVK
jgi:lipooligosaccharide transport system permease protein